jgi:hypothetical protein
MPPFRIGKCFLHPSANRLFQFLFIKLILHRRQLSFLTYCSVFYLVCMTSPTLCPLWPSFIIRPVKPMNKLAHAILAWLYTLWVNFSLFFIFFSCTLEFISFRMKLIINFFLGKQFERLFQFARRIEDLMFTVAPEEVSLYNDVLLNLHSLLYSISLYLEFFSPTNWIQLSIDRKCIFLIH